MFLMALLLFVTFKKRAVIISGPVARFLEWQYEGVFQKRPIDISFILVPDSNGRF